MSTHTADRPVVEVDHRRVRGAGGVRIIVRRELATKLLTKAFVLSTLFFALLTLVGTLVSRDGVADVPVLAHTAPAAELATSAGAVGGDAVELKGVADEAAGRALLEDGAADAVLVGDATSVQVLVEDSLDPRLQGLLQAVLQDRALREAAEDAGVDPAVLTAATDAAAGASALDIQAVGGDLAITDVLLGLGFAAGTVLVVLLWGIPLATDVMQEKVSRVVEILLTSVHPWQLLAGKVLATTVIGLTQLVVVLGAGLGALAVTGSLPDLRTTPAGVLLAGVVCLVLGTITVNTLMAGLAARVERQEDLSSALQPALGLALVPMAAAFYLVFDFASTPWLDIASVSPVLNTFVMPARMAVEPVPAWQLGVSLLVALGTTVAAFAAAGRVYAGSVLRSGGQVPLREALRTG